MPKYSFDQAKHLHYLIEDGTQKPLIGTTTAISILDKPGLTWWASGLCAEKFGWLNPRKYSSKECLEAARNGFINIWNMTGNLGTYMDFLNEAYRAHSKSKDKSADKGVDLHALLEQYIKSQINGLKQAIPLEIEAFAQWSEKNVKRFLFTELHCYSEVLFCGGIADFGYVDMQDNFVLGDFKSSPVPYYSHWLQCGGYDTQIQENGGFTSDGKQTFVSGQSIKYHAIFCAGKGLDKPFFNKETDRLRRAFAYVIKMYQEKIWWEDGKYVQAS